MTTGAADQPPRGTNADQAIGGGRRANRVHRVRGEQPAFAADYRNRDNGLIYEVNTKEWVEGKKLILTRADAIDTAILNKFLWQDRMGSIAMPAPHHGVFPASDPLQPSKRDLD